MTEEIPTWLTKDYVKTALQHDEDTKNILSVESIKVDNPVPKGNNGSCLIHRVQAEYKVKGKNDLQKISLYLKVPTKSGVHEFVANKGVYVKETQIYNELIPKYKSVFGDKWPNILPKSFYSTEYEVVILEDLVEKGYVMGDKVKQLSFEESALALKSLAIYHAASVKLYETEPELIRKCGTETFFREDMKDFFSGMINGFIHKGADECEKRSELKKYVNSIRKVAENVFDELIEISKPKENEFNVLNHGDYWTNNLMFKYIDNKPIDVIPVDLQMGRYASPGMDLAYFISGSIREDVRIEKLDDLLNLYLDKLNSQLEIFGSKKRIHITELKKALDVCGIYSVFISIGFLPFFLADQELIEKLEIKEMSVEEFQNIGNNSCTDIYFKNERYLNILQTRLEEFEKKGWFLNNNN
ncbi:uncharacterized protein LOC142322335 [Lycorma delicatula]|uniref:uncharacterized protein LOC142322335 n=1 Tax=Lycorma delicatula TaxID=130591 RepID=UPI003F51A9B8